MNAKQVWWILWPTASVALVLTLMYQHIQSKPPSAAQLRQAEAARYRDELSELSKILKAADSKGDRQSALAAMERVTALMRELNDLPGIAESHLANCRLAAVDLGDGIVAVYEGGRWHSQDRYRAAYADCG